MDDDEGCSLLDNRHTERKCVLSELRMNCIKVEYHACLRGGMLRSLEVFCNN